MVVAAKTKKKKNCQKGYPCGYSCQARTRSCKKPLSGQSASYQEYLKTQGEKLAEPKKASTKGDFDTFKKYQSDVDDLVSIRESKGKNSPEYRKADQEAYRRAMEIEDSPRSEYYRQAKESIEKTKSTISSVQDYLKTSSARESNDHQEIKRIKKDVDQRVSQAHEFDTFAAGQLRMMQQRLQERLREPDVPDSHFRSKRLLKETVDVINQGGNPSAAQKRKIKKHLTTVTRGDDLAKNLEMLLSLK